MNYQFKTSRCGHHGVIKPVKSTKGKHTGKWICRINGPSVNVKGKVVYSAPYIGAAKAAIAKSLHITVSEVEAVEASTDGGNPLPTRKTEENEFDDNDDEELANFDLNAAVSSAKKLSPQQKQQWSVSKSNKSVSKPCNINISTPNNLNATTYGYGQSSGGKPPHPKQSRKQNHPNLLSASMPTVSEKNEQKELDDILKVTEGLRLEKERLMKELSLAKEQKEELAKEADALRKKNEGLRDDANVAKKQKDRLKGETRAVREELEDVKSELKKTREQKEKYEKEAQIARGEKEKYSKETKAQKKKLDSHKAELGILEKQTSSKSAGTNNTVEPPNKKQKTGKQAKSGTVTKSMKVADMKEEAVARGIEVKEVSRMNKNDLQEMLVVGSNCITKTDAWGEVLRLREKFEGERQVAKEKEDKRQHELYLKAEKEERERQKQLKAAKEKERASELSSQEGKHTHHFPKVHSCKLAKTDELSLHGSPRCYSYTLRCSECSNRFDPLYTCEKCDYDICQECFKAKTMTPAEKMAEAKKRAKLEKERQEQEAERRRLEEEEEEEHRKKWDPQEQFKPKIIDPTNKNKDPDGMKKKGYTVWCSDGYGYDGWHSYEGPPSKEFDTTYKTKEEANERARYLFHWKNPWGLEPESIADEEVEKSMKDGLVTYVVAPPDSTTWTVSVVPDAAYAYMENATLHRHGHEDEDDISCELAY